MPRKSKPDKKPKRRPKARKHGSQKTDAVAPDAAYDDARQRAREAPPITDAEAEALAGEVAYTLPTLPTHLRQLMGGRAGPEIDHGQLPRVLKILCGAQAYRHLPYVMRVINGEESDTVYVPTTLGPMPVQVPVKHATRAALVLKLFQLSLAGAKVELGQQAEHRRRMAMPPLREPT